MKKLFLSVSVCLLAGFIGSVATFPSIPTWYAGLIKPPFNPPNWIFGPVWTTLYVLMGIAMYLVWRKKKSLKLFLIHLGVNAGWSIIFFGLHSVLGGLVTIIILWGCIYTLIREFYRIDRRASYLLYPYLAWVSFASLLNVALLILNP